MSKTWKVGSLSLKIAVEIVWKRNYLNGGVEVWYFEKVELLEVLVTSASIILIFRNNDCLEIDRLGI